jgi:hypothetical protein
MPKDRHPEQDPAEGSRKIVERQLAGNGRRKQVEDDAEGQFVRSHKSAGNDGMSSANPRPLSGDEQGDATFPLKRKE